MDDSAAEVLLSRVRSGVLVLPRNWAPVLQLLHHRGLLVLLGVVASSSNGRAGAAETARFALDCLEVSPESQRRRRPLDWTGQSSEARLHYVAACEILKCA